MGRYRVEVRHEDFGGRWSIFPKSGPVLVSDTPSRVMMLFTVYLCPLLETEMGLDGGRFRRFLVSMQGHEVRVRWVREHPKNHPSPPVHEYVVHAIALCDERLRGRWSMEVEARTVNDIDLIFVFEDEADAVLFKLWAPSPEALALRG